MYIVSPKKGLHRFKAHINMYKSVYMYKGVKKPYPYLREPFLGTPRIY